MLQKRLQRILEKNKSEFLGIVLRQYPDFILSDRVDRLSEIPVFAFHDVSLEVLDPMLAFLSENGYKTLTADEYLERRLRGERGQEREVLLTLDDGHKSLYEVVYPALKRFDQKAVAYIVPGMTPEGSTASRWKKALCDWAELREMHESGAVDIQSHSMYHHSVPVSDRIIDYVTPESDFSFLTSDLFPGPTVGGTKRVDSLPLGMPIHDWGARFGKSPAFRESEKVAAACAEYVAGHGGGDFFREAGWCSRLDALVRKVREEAPPAALESAEAQRAAMRDDFVGSKELIEQRLPGKMVRHFCFPWFRGSAIAAEVSAEAGYRTNAWGSLLPAFLRGDRIALPIRRFPETYIWRLPGKGRKAIGSILRERFSRKPAKDPSAKTAWSGDERVSNSL